MIKNWDKMTVDQKLDDLKDAIENLGKLCAQYNVTWSQRITLLERQVQAVIQAQQKAE